MYQMADPAADIGGFVAVSHASPLFARLRADLGLGDDSHVVSVRYAGQPWPRQPHIFVVTREDDDEFGSLYDCWLDRIRALREHGLDDEADAEERALIASLRRALDILTFPDKSSGDAVITWRRIGR